MRSNCSSDVENKPENRAFEVGLKRVAMTSHSDVYVQVNVYLNLLVIMENFAAYHYEAKTQLNKYNMHALLKLGRGFSLQGCIKGKFVLLTKQTCTTIQMDTGV